MRDFRQLLVWQKAHGLTLAVYALTSSFPRQHVLGLANQMQRAALSMTTGIADAAGRADRSDFVRSLQNSFGWANQLEYELLVARDLKVIEEVEHERLQTGLIEVKKMLNGLQRSVGKATES